MRRRLKTWKQFEEEFKSISDEWNNDMWNDLHIEYNNIYWCITLEMKKMFGTEIEVKEYSSSSDLSFDYTHKGESYAWHESWFEPEFEEVEFLSEEEVIL